MPQIEKLPTYTFLNLTTFRLLRILLLMFLFLLFIAGLILGLIGGPEFLLEIVYQLHKILVYSIVGLVVIMEGIISVKIIWEILWRSITKK